MHIAHIAATPLLVLVTVCSFPGHREFLAGSNEIAIDLSDPRIMVAFAFIIGAAPAFVELSGHRQTFYGKLK
jgi:hypothetical protein